MTVRLILFASTMALLNFSFAFSQNEGQATESFRVKVFVEEGSNKWQSKNIVLSFEKDFIVLRAPQNEFMTQFISYAEIQSAEYSHLEHQRKINPVTAVASTVFAPLLLKKVDEHWLTVQAEKDSTYIFLDKRTYRAVLVAFEARVGKKVKGWSVRTIAANR
jgi:hypothetical protein